MGRRYMQSSSACETCVYNVPFHMSVFFISILFFQFVLMNDSSASRGHAGASHRPAISGLLNGDSGLRRTGPAGLCLLSPRILTSFPLIFFLLL